MRAQAAARAAKLTGRLQGAGCGNTEQGRFLMVRRQAGKDDRIRLPERHGRALPGTAHAYQKGADAPGHVIRTPEDGDTPSAKSGNERKQL